MFYYRQIGIQQIISASTTLHIRATAAMTSIRTNIIRLQTQGNCYCYQAYFNNHVSQQDSIQIQTYIEELDGNIIYAHPYLYANQKLSVTQLQILLSKGENVVARFQFIQQKSKIMILEQLCSKLLRSLKFLPNRKIKSFFNPFEQKNNIIPGIQIHPIYEKSYSGISILPINLIYQPPVQVSSTKILLDYSTGRFYEPVQTVKVDKANNMFHFRNGQKVLISNLRKCKIKTNMNGIALVDKLRNYILRIKQNSKTLLQNWQIRIQNNYLSFNNPQLLSIGSVEFRDNNERSLVDIVSPMSRNTYNHNFRELNKAVTFQANLQAQLILIIPTQMHKDGKQIKHELQKLVQRMQLSKVKILCINICLQNRQEVYNMINTGFVNKLAIYILLVSKQPTNYNPVSVVPGLLSSTNNQLAQLQNTKYFIEQMINREHFFHIIRYCQQQESNQLDILAIRNLASIYCKMRMIPWKIKNLPFTDKPSAVCNINVQQTNNGTGNYSIALVLSMNLYFSKFCCVYAECQPDRIQHTVFTLLQQSLNKFHSVHKVYPFRVIVFRTGYISSLQQEHKSVKAKLSNYYASVNNKNSNVLSYVYMNKQHTLRTYLQTDQNYVSKYTVKKIQLLAYLEIQDRYYLQLQLEQPPVEIYINEKQKQLDPAFPHKILELIGKLSFGSVGNQFGKGMGFIDYASKLNQFKQFNLNKWERFLQEGVMIFL